MNEKLLQIQMLGHRLISNKAHYNILELNGGIDQLKDWLNVLEDQNPQIKQFTIAYNISLSIIEGDLTSFTNFILLLDTKLSSRSD